MIYGHGDYDDDDRMIEKYSLKKRAYLSFGTQQLEVQYVPKLRVQYGLHYYMHNALQSGAS